MTSITFPSTPTVGAFYTASNGATYQFDGVKWISVSSTTSDSDTNFNSFLLMGA